MTENIEILIAKYFVNQITESEEKELKKWLQKQRNKKIFEEYIEVNSIKSEKSNFTIRELIPEKGTNKSYYSFMEYAAVFVLGFGIYYLNSTTFSKLMKPSQIATFNQGINIRDVNTSKYVSWKRGELLFDKDPFSYIVKKLTHHFNVEIISNNKKLNQKKITGRFNKENILEIFKAHTSFKYTIENNSIFIN